MRPILGRPGMVWAAFLLSVSAYALLIWDIGRTRGVEFVPEHKIIELWTYAILSAFCSAGTFLTRRRNVMRTTLAVGSILAMLTATTFREYSPLGPLAFGAHCLAWAVHEPFPRGSLLGALTGLAGVSLCLYRGLEAPAAAAVAMAVLCAAFGTGLMTSYRERLISALDRLGQLDLAVQRLSDANLGYQHYAETAAASSMLAERQRITREIHDIVGYTITNSIMIMEAATDMVVTHPQRVRQLMATARENAERGLQEVRRALRALRNEFEDAEEAGLRRVVKLVNIFEIATGVEVDISYGNIPWSCGNRIDEALYHAVQESLVNAFRHGKASRVNVQFWVADGTISLTIRDNGIGLKQATEGIGLSGMRENVHLLGGRFSTGGTDDGFQVHIDLPVDGKAVPDKVAST